MNNKNYNDLVSIIIPVFNVEKFVDETIHSACSQTHRNIEVIIIDDGSSDSSGKICDKWAKIDRRVRVFHQNNRGVSAARNIGIKNAQGKYIIFIDGDDYVDNDYVAYLLSLVDDTNYPVGMNYSFYNIFSSSQSPKPEFSVITSEDAAVGIYDATINVAVWNKIYSKSFLEKNKILFDERIWFGEGMLFNIMCLSKIMDVPMGNKKVYHQVYNTKSAMRSFNMNSRKNGLKSIELQRKQFKGKSVRVNRAIDYHLKYSYLSILTQIIKTNTKHLYKEEYKKCKKEIRRNFGVVLGNNIPIKRKILFFVAAIFPTWVAKREIRKEKEVETKKSAEVR